MTYSIGQLSVVLSLMAEESVKRNGPIPRDTQLTLDGEPVYVTGYFEKGGFLLVSREKDQEIRWYEPGHDPVRFVFLSAHERSVTRWHLLEFKEDGTLRKTEVSTCTSFC